ncbi:MAG: hypothetical protein WC683_08035 [bacterium]
MAFTYDLTTAIGKVRFLIPDDDSANYDFEDDEITHLLTLAGSNVTAAAIKGCRLLSRKYAKRATLVTDARGQAYAMRSNDLAKRADELEKSEIGGMSTLTLTRQDGYHDESTTSEYERAARIVYIDQG